MRKLVLVVSFGLFGFIQNVQAQQVIFSCKTTNNKYIEVQKVSNNFYEYKFGSASKNELTIRNKQADLLGRSAKWDGIGRYRWATMAFQQGEYLYSVNTSLDSIEHTVESSVIVERKGKLLTQVNCTPETAQSNFNDDNFAW
ncbi:hypothetical protein NYR60_07195 [Actinobacillus genomosp. 2]|uniref:hypothetical protein n=1 Tax=Actinobacillus genomosp. 2 TaxID=230709 RepID=UPI00244278CB|nr:hypothetical protein [Actinobacillus genomosp. 2]WGE31643.1 hypothetical protein NYR60_07195 [Actinobacillus genomosp. 2]